MKRLSLIIPVYNGEQYLVSSIAELEAFHQTQPFHEVIFVDDGSTDNTNQVLIDTVLSSTDKKLKAKEQPLPVTILKHEKNKGKGSAIKFALKHAKQTDIIGFTDVELPYGLEKIKDVLQQFKQANQTEIIIGKRTQSQKDYTRYRLIYTKLFRFLLPKAVGEFTDTQCGFKFFRYKAAKELFAVLKTTQWVFDIELLLAAKAQAKDIAEILVTIKPQCKTRGNISILTHGPQIIKDMHSIKSNEKHHRYNAQKV